jgi:AGZA family xanthine/uracil permease-like MFS transporter
LRTDANPLFGLVRLAVILIGYYARVKWPLPTGLMALLIGMVLARSNRLIDPSASAWQQSLSTVIWHTPTLQFTTLWQARADLFPWLGVIVPMALFNVTGLFRILIALMPQETTTAPAHAFRS